MDKVNLHCGANIGKYSFYISANFSQYPYFEICDTLLIDAVRYYDVFKLGSPQQPYTYDNFIKLDSLYYNYEYGILKIIMSNGEFYKIRTEQEVT